MTDADAPQSSFSPADLAARVEARLEVARRSIKLPGDALVMRGGTLQRSDLERALILSRHKLKRPGLSVFAADVPTPGDLLDLKPLPNHQLAFTTVARLEDAGFALEQTGDWPHHTTWLPEDNLSDDGYWLQMFCRAFDKPVHRDKLAAYRVSQH